MKVIDIMQKVANEEIFKFRIDDVNYYVDKSNYICEEDGTRVEWYIDDEWLNMNVEVIEDKKIEKLENEKQFYSYRKYADIKNDIDKILYIIKGLNLTEEKIDNLNNKINEIIDYINGGTNGE